jgi:nucleotide-binding universal stress UspA family protein
MKKVLIALDYDPPMQKIAEMGYDLAKHMNAEIVLVHEVAPANYYTAPNYSPIIGFEGFTNLDMTQPSEIDHVNRAAEDFMDRAKKLLGDDHIQTLVKEGDFAGGILDAASETNADLIVMGCHGRRGLDKILMGSVVEQVLHKTRVPLFIVPTKMIHE